MLPNNLVKFNKFTESEYTEFEYELNITGSGSFVLLTTRPKIDVLLIMCGFENFLFIVLLLSQSI